MDKASRKRKSPEEESVAEERKAQNEDNFQSNTQNDNQQYFNILPKNLWANIVGQMQVRSIIQFQRTCKVASKLVTNGNILESKRSCFEVRLFLSYWYLREYGVKGCGINDLDRFFIRALHKQQVAYDIIFNYKSYNFRLKDYGGGYNRIAMLCEKLRAKITNPTGWKEGIIEIEDEYEEAEFMDNLIDKYYPDYLTLLLNAVPGKHECYQTELEINQIVHTKTL